MKEQIDAIKQEFLRTHPTATRIKVSKVTKRYVYIRYQRDDVGGNNGAGGVMGLYAAMIPER